MNALFLKTLMTLSLTLAQGASPDAIYAYTVNAHGIRFRVPSNGCTWKRSFATVTNEVRGLREIRLMRTLHDPCLALLPGGMVINFTNDELGVEDGQAVVVTNELMKER